MTDCVGLSEKNWLDTEVKAVEITCTSELVIALTQEGKIWLLAYTVTSPSQDIVKLSDHY